MSIHNSNEISFKGKHFFVGFDVHKARWVVTIRHNGLSLCFDGPNLMVLELAGVF